jgi:hypothetical protein
MEMKPLRFIGEEIECRFDRPPLLEKQPGCPSSLIWRGQEYRIVEMLREWHDHTRRGRMARNMSPAHLATSSERGSWGVGRDYYRVRCDGGRCFDLYYDRAPTGGGGAKGSWFLFRELTPCDDEA